MPESIYIHLQEGAQARLGGSYWFGYPDLPVDMPLPMVEDDGEEFALTLICQINLADLPDNDDLPATGLLQFYADIAYYRGDWDEPAISMHISDNRVCRVLYIPEDRFGELENTQTRFFEQDEAKAIPLIFNKIKPSLDEPELQLFGTTSHLEWEDWPAPCKGWQLLLMMDSMQDEDYSYNFFDCGVLCFLIEPEALRRRDFSNVRTIILST